MAENETTAPDQEGAAAVAEQEAAEQEYQYAIKVEDAGPATKKVRVEIPPERITEQLAKQFKELRSQAAIPGFRPGHAPQKLIEKRFGGDVKEQVRRTLVSESYEQALAKNSLQVIGEPEFAEAEKIQLPESGPLTYSFSVEVQPQITLPELKGLKIRKPKIEVKEENVDQAMANLREQQGTLVPIEDRGIEEKDYVTADIHVKLDGNVVTHAHDQQLVARPGRIAGIQIDDVSWVIGAKVGETRSTTVKAPETHPNEQLRGKDVQIEAAIKDLKKLELAEINQDFLDGLGFTNEQELRDALKEQMVDRIDYDIQEAQREQVRKYLLDSVQIELPTKLSEKQADRVVGRRMMDLMMRGLPREQVEAASEALRGGAKEEGARELKLFFILQQVANDSGVDVDEAELNGRIAMLAAQRGRRPEKLKQDMSKDGSLANLYVQLREQKAIDKILESAQIEEVDMSAEQARKEAGGPEAEGESSST